MKRAPLFVVTGTVAGLAGILSFHTHPQTSALAAPSGTTPAAHSASQPAKRHGHSGAKAAASAPASGTATGATEQYGYGALAVRISLHSGRIVHVSVPYIQTAEQYSQQLASQVIPTLNNEVLSAQSARINGVSGATYTCQAYAASLQAALDKLHQA